MISTPGGKVASNQIIRNIPNKLGSKIIKTELILLALGGIDVILGMDWMTRYGVALDIPSRVLKSIPHPMEPLLSICHFKSA